MPFLAVKRNCEIGVQRYTGILYTLYTIHRYTGIHRQRYRYTIHPVYLPATQVYREYMETCSIATSGVQTSVDCRATDSRQARGSVNVVREVARGAHQTIFEQHQIKNRNLLKSTETANNATQAVLLLCLDTLVMPTVFPSIMVRQNTFSIT